MTPPTLNITEETHIIDSRDSLSISCRYSALSLPEEQRGPGPSSRQAKEAADLRQAVVVGAPKAAPPWGGQAWRPGLQLLGLPGSLGVGATSPAAPGTHLPTATLVISHAPQTSHPAPTLGSPHTGPQPPLPAHHQVTLHPFQQPPSAQPGTQWPSPPAAQL